MIEELTARRSGGDEERKAVRRRGGEKILPVKLRVSRLFFKPARDDEVWNHLSCIAAQQLTLDAGLTPCLVSMHVMCRQRTIMQKR